MKAAKVLKLLNITRPTLCKYIKNGTLSGKKSITGVWNYDEESVYNLLGWNKEKRYAVIYCRVSTVKQKKDLENQKELLQQFCSKNGYLIREIYQDIGYGINFERYGFNKL